MCLRGLCVLFHLVSGNFYSLLNFFFDRFIIQCWVVGSTRVCVFTRCLLSVLSLLHCGQIRLKEWCQSFWTREDSFCVCPSMWPILESFHALWVECYVFVLGRTFNRYLLNPFECMMSINSDVSLFNFCLDYLSTGKSAVLKSSTVNGLVLISV